MNLDPKGLTPEKCEDNTECSKASRYQLGQAGITDEHGFKTEWGAVPNSRYDICACKDGSIVIKAQGQCGKSSPKIETDASWKKAISPKPAPLPPYPDSDLNLDRKSVPKAPPPPWWLLLTPLIIYILAQ
jgi:hypothetical protein